MAASISRIGALVVIWLQHVMALALIGALVLLGEGHRGAGPRACGTLAAVGILATVDGATLHGRESTT